MTVDDRPSTWRWLFFLAVSISYYFGVSFNVAFEVKYWNFLERSEMKRDQEPSCFHLLLFLNNLVLCVLFSVQWKCWEISYFWNSKSFYSNNYKVERNKKKQQHKKWNKNSSCWEINGEIIDLFLLQIIEIISNKIWSFRK